MLLLVCAVGLPLSALVVIDAVHETTPLAYVRCLAAATLLGVGLVFAHSFGERLASQLRQLGLDTTVLGSGQLAHRTTVAANDEIGRLARTLDKMAEALQQRDSALLAREECLREIVDNLPALVSYLDPQERFRFANRTFMDWLGLEPSALLGRSLREVYGDTAYQDIRPNIETALAGRRTVYERDLNTLDGPRRIEVNLVPQRGPDGGVHGLYVLRHDITERREAAIRLARSEERLSLALEASSLALFDWDVRAERIYHSGQASLMRGGMAIEAVTTPAELYRQVHPADLAYVMLHHADALLGSVTDFDVEYRVRTQAGPWIWLRSRGHVAERDAPGRAIRMIGTDADITDRKATQDRLRQLAEFDVLTHLPNRGLFNDRLHMAWERSTRSGRPLAVVFVDVDHFKRINDTYGHAAGDEVLKSVATRIKRSVRSADTVARLAGDEFTVIVEDLPSREDVDALAMKIVQAVREPMQLSGREVTVTASLGIAIRGCADVDGPGLLRRADAALYDAKAQGRDGFSVACDESAHDFVVQAVVSA